MADVILLFTMKGNTQMDIMNIEEVAGLLRVSTKTIRRMIADGRFPPPIKFSERKHFWHRAEIESLVAR